MAAEADGHGYLCLHGLCAGDAVEALMDMPVRLVHAHARVQEDHGQAAVMRGPVVFCAEAQDQPMLWDALRIRSDSHFLCQFRPDLLDGVMTLTNEQGVMLIPYAVWNNRGTERMTVWMPEDAADASLYS